MLSVRNELPEGSDDDEGGGQDGEGSQAEPMN
jgi:hypothetical protein